MAPNFAWASADSASFIFFDLDDRSLFAPDQQRVWRVTVVRAVVPVLQSKRLLLPVISAGGRHDNLERFKFILGFGVA